MSNIQCIAEHTIDLSLLTRDSKVLDLGCREFSWSREMLHYVDKVFCVDADKDVKSFNNRLPVMNVAVSDTNDKQVQFIKFGNGTGNHIHRGNNPKPSRCKEQVTNTMTLPTIIAQAWGVEFIDLIKFDIENEEIPVLLSLTAPPARQITCELHKHLGATEEQIQAVFAHVAQWYDMAYYDYSRKHGLCDNYWDVLWVIKKELP